MAALASSTGSVSHDKLDLREGAVLDADMREMIAWIQRRLKLAGLPTSKWNADMNDVVSAFLGSPDTLKLVFYLAAGDELAFLTPYMAMPVAPSSFVYFVRAEATPVTPELIDGAVTWGTVAGGGLDALVDLMDRVFLPGVSAQASWPAGIRRDFMGQMHRFMASLTETANQAHGQTVLYIPNEMLPADPAAAASDKDLVQRLESTVIHWTRQIKDVISHTDAAGSAARDSAGPLAEIDFWRRRVGDLSGIADQLERPGVVRIVRVLECADSSYLKPYMALSSEIQQGSAVAVDNLRFLETLTEPCERLNTCSPVELGDVLPDVLNRLRVIASVSKHYRSPAVVKGLLRKVSTEVIRVCKHHINLDDVLYGDVPAAMVALHECIAAVGVWHAAYERVVDAIAALPPYARRCGLWDFEAAEVFAEADAFAQRCRDLLELCNGQTQFARKVGPGGEQADIPVFAGSRGTDITASICTIEREFQRYVNVVAGVKADILNPKASRWHEVNNIFKGAMKDLEVMMSNIIATAFDGVTSLPTAVELLESFDGLARRPAVRKAVEKRAVEVFGMFIDQMNAAKQYFEAHAESPPLDPEEPPYAGAALWTRGIQGRIEADWECLRRTDCFLGELEIRAQAGRLYDEHMRAYEDHIRKLYSEWLSQLSSSAHDSEQVSSRLNTSLLVRVKELSASGDSRSAGMADAGPAVDIPPVVVKYSGLLRCNFDKQMHRMFFEVHFWESFQGKFLIPFHAADVTHNLQDSLRVVRENVMTIVRQYNAIITSLTADERAIFSDAVKRLDRKILPGLAHLTWTTKPAQREYYLRECKRHAAEMEAVVNEFHRHRAAVDAGIKAMASMSLIFIEKNYVHEEGEFESRQEAHRAAAKAKLTALHESMLATLAEMYAFVEPDGHVVQTAWARYVQQVDSLVFRALRSSVRRSLQELQKAICGDTMAGKPVGEADLSPLFRLYLVLDSGRVEYQPSIIALTHTVNNVAKQLTTCIAVVKRVGDELEHAVEGEYHAAAAAAAAAAAEPLDGDASSVGSMDEVGAMAERGRDGPGGVVGQKPSFYNLVVNDEEILQTLLNIMNGMNASATKDLARHRQTFENPKYKALWEKDKQQTFVRFAKKHNPLSNYDNAIQNYRMLSEEIRSKESASRHIHFVLVDHTLIKNTLIQHCTEFQDGYCNLLHDNAQRELRALQQYMQENMEALSASSTDLSHLSQQIKRLHSVQDDMPITAARFEPLARMYEMLTSYNVIVPDTEAAALAVLPMRWEAFTEQLADVEAKLKVAKSSMKKDLQDSMASFSAAVAALKSESKSGLPYEGQYSPEEALHMVAQWRDRLAALSQRESELAPGIAVFDIPYSSPAELKQVETDLDLLQAVWALWAEWRNAWESWKTARFVDLRPDELASAAGGYKQRINRMRDIKQWPVWTALDTQIKQFLSTMPLITDLGAEAMRARHWDALKQHLGAEFDQTALDFTLARVWDLGLHNHADFIAELSANAAKELSIERALGDIEEQWASMQIELSRHKDMYWKISSTDDLFQALEDHLVALSSMKASKFYASFTESVNYWEAKLSLVSEAVEGQLAVQRAWLYLESIFMSSEDIRRQLPAEAAMFEQVNDTYMRVTERLAADLNAVRACSEPGYLEEIAGMNGQLEEIQKSLNDYLEKKRQEFPRFYFVSDADLLEILGQSRDPTAVQKHLSKCFVGIKSLQLTAPGTNDTKSNRVYEATAMRAPDGETVPLERVVPLAGAVEVWLNVVEDVMRVTVRQVLGDTIVAYRDATRGTGDRTKAVAGWISDCPGQLLITTGMIMFTVNTEKQLRAAEAGNPKALRRLVKNQHKYLSMLAGIVRGNITKLVRRKLVALITIELHSRDVMERLRRAKVTSPDAFLWQSQLRLTWRKGEGDAQDPGVKYGICEAQQTHAVQPFGYEYQGNNGRLVITPLTDRCVLTITTALSMFRGTAPAGPAGTGKTETVKDLGKSLAMQVVVTNCSDEMDYKSVGRMFSGLVQAGAWGCFDEFNRINIEVLSVVAQQVMSIMDALARGAQRMTFMDAHIRVRREVGIFITMNPGYAGRTELPDNLKSMFRPVAMMVPDMALIAEVMLQAEGFETAKFLAEKVVTLYRLMVQQLSKQDHYDFGLRSMRGVLVCAGALKRSSPDSSEELLLLQAIRDMNVPKFIKDDARLFMALLGDLFPGLELPEYAAGQLGTALDAAMRARHLQALPVIRQKAIELRDSKATRHCNMLVGRTLAGKSVVWRALADAYSALADAGEEGYMRVRTQVINPKSVTMNELYGAYDLQTMEWTDGVLSTVFREFANDERAEEKWLVLDGPVDTLWIESMNTVMDDNRTLTLINGDRIAMTPTMSLLFEVQDLAVASPATVSRAGMVYVDVADLPWQAIIDSWLERAITGIHADQDRALFKALFDKYMPALLGARQAGQIQELVPTNHTSCLVSLCHLLECLFADTELRASRAQAGEAWPAWAEKVFVFACTWSLGGAAEDRGRRHFTDALREVEPNLPTVGLLYDYGLDSHSLDFKPWADRVPSAWRPAPNTAFANLIVPTVDTARFGYLLRHLIANRKYVLLTGETGTGKTLMAQQLISRLDREAWAGLQVNMSSATTSESVQAIIEGAMDKRAKNKMGPPAGRRMIALVDDLNMPARDLFGSQPPLELLRQWIDYGGWYDRAKQSWRYIQDMQLLAAMGPPGGGRAVISERLQSRFLVLNFAFPPEKQVKHIFESIMAPGYAGFEEEVKRMVPAIMAATVNLYHDVVSTFLPTPTKAHYLFNLRDVARVVQGMLRADVRDVTTTKSVLRLWVHECARVLGDRLSSEEDLAKFRDMLDAQLSKTLGGEFYSKLMEGLETPEAGPLFQSFADPERYQEVEDLEKAKAMAEDALAEYNDTPGKLPMELVLFRDALRHVARIHRIITTPRGNAMLIGVGGSGRQSLARLAAFMADETAVFQIEITKSYRQSDFREDLKSLYRAAGVEGKPTMFLFTDTQIKEESFLEDINNILSSGQVPNLYTKDERAAVLDELRPAAREAGIDDTPDELWAFFVQRVREQLHVALAMSPVGSAFRERTRQYPALVSCTTMDWFFPWPAEALQEVSMRFLGQLQFAAPPALPEADDPMAAKAAADARAAWLSSERAIKQAIAASFASMHTSVMEASERMLMELRRHNYVTPSNFLELVKGYRELLAEKRAELGDARDKLANGLAKLDEAREQVQVLSVELEDKQAVVKEKSAQCDQLMMVTETQRDAANVQRAEVESDRERISKEEETCQSIADEAERDLAEVMPALEAAMAAVDTLDGRSISEVKAYNSPPVLVRLVLEAVQTLFGLPVDWANAKKKLSEGDFLQQIKRYDKDNIKPATLKKLRKYTSQPVFDPVQVKTQSSAAAALCAWCRAVEVYALVVKEVEPKREKARAAMRELRRKQDMLAEAEGKLKEVMSKVAQLTKEFEDAVAERTTLTNQATALAEKLDRAEKLVSGLSGEKERWQEAISKFEAEMELLPGDCLVAAAFSSYAGPFDTVYRERLVKQWTSAVQSADVPLTPGFSFAAFLAKPTDLQSWKLQGLPADQFSTENGVIVTRGRRWPLMVDPQGQANKWVKNMASAAGLRVTDLHAHDFLRTLEQCITLGLPYLLQDVGEELDPALEPVLARAVVKKGARKIIRLGDKELDFSDDFRFYLTTKLPNPHYTPEVSTKAAIVNFAVKQQGLDAQMLSIVVQSEQPELERQKDELVRSVARGKKTLVELETRILYLLSTVEGSLLDNDDIVATLQQSKTTAEEVTEQLRVSEETEVKIDAAREGYRPVSARAALLYFVLSDLATVDPMYQFSLDAYVALFEDNIKASRKAMSKAAMSGMDSGAGSAEEELARRIKGINEYHSLEVYRWACLGLFESHKLLLSLQICSRILGAADKLPQAEWDFFLRGGVVLDRSEQRPNPAPEWLDSTAWDNITELDKLPAFAGMVSSVEQSVREWAAWFMSAQPETEPLPGEWATKLSDLQAMVTLRCLRPDRVMYAAAAWVASSLKPAYVEPPALDLRAVWENSNAATPLVFVLSAGVDPTRQVVDLHRALSTPERPGASPRMSAELRYCSLGQGQAPVATRYIEEGLRTGGWVLLQNCHLSISWLPELEKIIERYCAAAAGGEGTAPHPDFRLWLSSAPHPKFPIAILQRGTKITMQPPRGLRANLLRLYNQVPAAEFSQRAAACPGSSYQRLLFCLTWFHAVLLERRKFRSLGWNIPYEFNDSDFSICKDILATYLAQYPSATPWDALRYLIAEANYGGRVTDDMDRRLANVYIRQFFNDGVLDEDMYALAPAAEAYYVPEDGELKSYKEYITGLPQVDPPEAFGQHPNADISSAIAESSALLSTTLSLQPRLISSGGESSEFKVQATAEELLGGLPHGMDVAAIKKALHARGDPEPLKVVLLQEIDRYNALLAAMSASLTDLLSGIAGTTVITAELEDIFTALLEGRVPSAWGFAYPSLKALGSWTRDLFARVAFIRDWAERDLPRVFWLPGFTYPTSFFTALLQSSARKNGVPINMLDFEFPVINQEADAIQSAATEGAYVRGLFLEGARWDYDAGCLAEPYPMELSCSMPIIHFKPVELGASKRGKADMYACPLYLYPVRTGTRERPSFMRLVEVKSGDQEPDFWTLRGTALLLSLAS